MSDENTKSEHVDLVELLVKKEKTKPPRKMSKKQKEAWDKAARKNFVAKQHRHTTSVEERVENLRQGRLKVAHKFAGNKTWGALIRDPRFIGDDSPKAFQTPIQQRNYDKAFELYLLGHTHNDIVLLTKVSKYTLHDWRRKYKWKDKKDKFKSGVELGPAYETATTEAQKMNSDLENLPEPAKDIIRQMRKLGEDVRLTLARALLRGGMEIDEMDGKQVLTNIETLKNVAITTEKVFGNVSEERPSINVLTQSATIVESLPAAKTFDVNEDDV
jgi:hypothetical protein